MCLFLCMFTPQIYNYLYQISMDLIHGEIAIDSFLCLLKPEYCLLLHVAKWQFLKGKIMRLITLVTIMMLSDI